MNVFQPLNLCVMAGSEAQGFLIFFFYFGDVCFVVKITEAQVSMLKHILCLLWLSLQYRYLIQNYVIPLCY